MSKHSNISASVIRRLPRYYRFLGELADAGVSKISSRELAERMSLTASQIRQDLNCFGGFGQQGYGYNVAELHAQIGSILHLNGEHKAVLIGAGNLGRAISDHLDFAKFGFKLIGIFDRDPAVIGERIAGLEVRSAESLGEFCKENQPRMAILCIPRDGAKNTVSTLMSCNVTAFWNYSHYDILGDFPDAVVENVHLNDSLMALSYEMGE